MPPRIESTMSTSPEYAPPAKARRVNIPSVARPATTPAAPARLMNDRREISGSSGQPHGFVAGVASSVVM